MPDKNTIAVLDDGFVRLVDVMGTDSAIVQAARISYGDGTKTPSDDRHLIRYLMRHRHTSQFEQCELKFHIRLPMDVMRQLVRHRTASLNEYSTRYSVAIDSHQKHYPGDWRYQAKSNQQGSDGFVINDNASIALESTKKETQVLSDVSTLYKALLDQGIAREQARSILPLSTYTEVYWKIDLHNLFHFLRLRLDSHAQQEIRTYAKAIYKLTKTYFPIATEAFDDYVLYSCTFSKQECDALRTLLVNNADTALTGKIGKLQGRELEEFQHKLCMITEGNG
jgi:thymidylate synthase (FAD)